MKAQKELRRYFLLTFAYSWMFFGTAIVMGRLVEGFPSAVVAPIGGLGPIIMAVFLTYRSGDRADRKDFWQRVVDFRRIDGLGWAVILLATPLVTLLSLLVSHVFSGSPFTLALEEPLQGSPLQILGLAVFMLFFGPIPEELGWRGYAQDRLQARWHPVAASAILGAVWALWHVPLFFAPGTYQYGLGAGSLTFWLYLLNLIPVAVIYGWLYNHTNRSTFSAILFHYSINFMGELIWIPEEAGLWMSVLWVLPAVLVILFGNQSEQVEYVEEGV